jgi:hypothetical protein
VQGEQVYVTHCLPADSVYNRPGFEVRATSTSDAALHQFALAYPAYELPLDLRRPGVQPADAPTRLALLAAPGGRSALVHTSYLPEDTCGRKNSFFSDVLIYPSLTLRQAVSTWNSPDWRLDYPSGAPKALASLPNLPRPGPINDAALAAFLAERDEHRRLLRWVLQGIRLVLQAPEESPRCRLYILAEPGQTALLLYGASRLLPEVREGSLSFSTYESLHRVLREYRLARVVGTWAGSRDRSLDEDFFTIRGYAIDAVNPRCSPELERDVPPLVDEAIDMAANGRWTDIDAAFTFLAGGPVPALAPALQALASRQRLAEGHGGPDDLLALLRLEQGRAAVARISADRIWPVVRDHAATNETIRHCFGPLLREPAHRRELIDRAGRALIADDPNNWELQWGLLRSLFRDDLAERRQVFLDVLRSGGEPSRLRPLLVKEWTGLADGANPTPAEVHPLLRPRDQAELEALARQDALFAGAASLARGASALPLLQARCRHLLASAAQPEQILDAFSRFHSPASSEMELKRVLAAWVKMLEGVPPARQQDLHPAFLLRFVPEELRGRVAGAFIKRGLLNLETWRRSQDDQGEGEDVLPTGRLSKVLILTHVLAFAAGFALAWLLAQLL